MDQLYFNAPTPGLGANGACQYPDLTAYQLQFLTNPGPEPYQTSFPSIGHELTVVDRFLDQVINTNLARPCHSARMQFRSISTTSIPQAPVRKNIQIA